MGNMMSNSYKELGLAIYVAGWVDIHVFGHQLSYLLTYFNARQCQGRGRLAHSYARAMLGFFTLKH